LASKAIEFREKMQNKGYYTPFKVTEDSINQKPVCDLLLVINTNWHPMSYHFGVIAAYCSNALHFWATFWGGQGATYHVHVRFLENT